MHVPSFGDTGRRYDGTMGVYYGRRYDRGIRLAGTIAAF